MADTILASLKEACDDSDASLDVLEGMEGSTFLEALIAAREEEEDDFPLRIPGTYPIAQALIEKFSQARATVTGETFDQAWALIDFNFDVSVWGGSVFEPVILGNGALLIRNHHRVLGVGDAPAAILKIHPQRLKADLERLFRKSAKRLEPCEAFILHRTSHNEMVRLSKPPRKFSEVGQTLAFIGHEAPVATCRALPPAILTRVQEQSRSGHVVLRIFGDHVFVYPLYRFSDDLDVLLEEYAEARFDDGDTDQPLGVEITSHIRSLQARFGERTREYLSLSDFPFPDASDVMSFHVAQKTTAASWGSYAGRKAADASNLVEFFADQADRPVNYADSFCDPQSDSGLERERWWSISARGRHDLFMIEAPFFAFAPSDQALASLTPASLKSRLAALAPFVRSMKGLRQSDDEKNRIWRLPDLLRKSGIVADYSEAIERVRRQVTEDMPEASPEEIDEYVAETLIHDPALRLVFVFSGLKTRKAIDFNGLHAALCRLSGDLKAGIVWRFPRFGLIQSYADGDLDSGNQALFCLTEEAETDDADNSVTADDEDVSDTGSSDEEIDEGDFEPEEETGSDDPDDLMSAEDENVSDAETSDEAIDNGDPEEETGIRGS